MGLKILEHQTLDNTATARVTLVAVWTRLHHRLCWPTSGFTDQTQSPRSPPRRCSGLTQMTRLSEQVPRGASHSKINPWFISPPLNHIWLPRTSQSWLVTGLPAPARGQLSCGSAGLACAANCDGTVGDHTWLIGRVLSLWIVSTNLHGKLTIKIKLITRWNQLGTFSRASLLPLQASSVCFTISHKIIKRYTYMIPFPWLLTLRKT